MSKQELINLVLQAEKQMPLGVNQEEYLMQVVQLQLPIFDDNYQELERQLKEIIEMMKDPVKRQELEELMNQNNTQENVSQPELSQDEALEFLVTQLGSKSNSLENILEEISEEMKPEFNRRIMNSLEEYRVRMDPAEIMLILKQENQKNNNKITERFKDDMTSCVSSDLISTLNNVVEAKEENLSNRAVMRNYRDYGENLYEKIVEYIKSRNFDNISFRENYYEIITMLRRQVRLYEEHYMDMSYDGYRKVNRDIDLLLEETMHYANSMNQQKQVQSPEERYSELSAMFK